jgi:hypothetical protein
VPKRVMVCCVCMVFLFLPGQSVESPSESSGVNSGISAST